MNCTATYVGTATLILEIGTLRLITDPALDPAGTAYLFEPAPGITIPLHKLADPALTRDALGPLDAALLSHDEHPDNLDTAGRALLDALPLIVTTAAGARRLGTNAHGLAPWMSLELPGDPPVCVTAVPARHGPDGTEAVIGETTGFVLEWHGQRDGAVYISGDTVWFDELEEIGRRWEIASAIVHMGAGGFEISGDVRFSLDAAAAAELADVLRARTLIPVHYDGWAHFTQPADETRRILAASHGGRVQWLEPGRPTPLGAT